MYVCFLVGIIAIDPKKYHAVFYPHIRNCKNEIGKYLALQVSLFIYAKFHDDLNVQKIRFSKVEYGSCKKDQDIYVGIVIDFYISHGNTNENWVQKY